MILRRKISGVVLLFFLLTGGLFAQDAEPAVEEEIVAEDAPDEEPVEEATGLTEEKIIEMDIRTSTLAELAAWCRSLGLSEGGGREELAARLRATLLTETPAMPAGPSPVGGEGKEPRNIVIESARSTEYFTLDVVDEEYARLRGNVIVSLKDGEAVHRISAQEILYNRTRNQMTASGGVSYVKEEGATIETFKGDSITVNLDSWATLMTEGISERSLQGEETAYRFAGTVISRSEEEVTILKNATVTNATTKESYWSLNATKLWLLPGSDFALQNAVLKVGEIPMLYIPFFYYPADEVIFHPVVGYRSREGNFVQTTTYILGRPKPEDLKESSLTKIMGSGAEMEKERQGIFLRSTGKKAVNPSETSLKALFDLYANLGGYFGVEMKTPRKGILGDFSLSAGLGRTRDLMPIGEGYTPYPRYDGTFDWNRSQLFSSNIPFRYRFNTTGSLAGKVGSFSWEIPYYSDPFMDRDFLTRTESMDWFNVIQQGAALTEETVESMLNNYEWRFNGRVNITPPKILAPYLTTLSVSNLNSTLLFNYQPSVKYGIMNNTYSPSRYFYIPEKLTIYSVSFGLGGTPLTLGYAPASAPTADELIEDPLKNIGHPRSPWGNPEDRGDPAARPSQGAGILAPPVLGQSFSIASSGGPQFTIDYRINPVAVSELQFKQDNWKEAEKVDWQEVSSVLSTIRGDANTSFVLSHPQGAYTTAFRLSGSGSYQSYLFTNQEANDFDTLSEVQSALSRIYNQTFFNTAYDYTGTVKPLYSSEVWGNSSLSYSFKGLLAKSIFDPTSISAAGITTPDDAWDARPRWDIEYGAWDKEHLDSHQLNANLAANVMDKAQTLTFSTELPPRDSSLTGNFATRIWISEFTGSMRVLEPWEEEKRKLEPLSVTGALQFGTLGRLEQHMVYDPEKNEYTTLTSSLSFWGFSANYTAVHGIPYEFVYDPLFPSSNGWTQKGTALLHSQDLKFGFTKSLPAWKFWKDRISFSFNVSSSLLIDLQRYTYSKFDASFGLTLGINNFLDLSLSTNSENQLIYQYLRHLPGFDLPVATDGESNVFVDLLNSYRFDSDQLRTESGFKLKTFKFDATHHLGDWNAILGITLAPYLEPGGGKPYYQFNTQVSFTVQWLPISEIKSEITVDKDKWVFK
jgi:hypothetical protein